MTEVSFIADVHVGNHAKFGGPLVCSINSRCRLILAALRMAADEAFTKGPLVVAGDLFDTERPEAPILFAIQNILASAAKSPAYNAARPKPLTWLIPGNHDNHSDEAGDSALAPLYAENLVSVIYEPAVQRFGTADTGYIDVAMIPYRSGSTRKWLPEEVDRLMSEYTPPKSGHGIRVLCIHAGLATVSSPPYLKDSHDAIDVSQIETIMAQHGFEYCVAGNWHRRVRFDKPTGPIMQIGALVPTGFDNPGLGGYGSIITVGNTHDGSHTIFVREIKGPRFVKVKSETELKNAIKAGNEYGHKLFIEYEADAEDKPAADALLQSLKNDSKVWAFDVVPSEVKTKKVATADDAAELSVDDFIAQWIDEMPLAPGVDRQDVKSIVSKCLK